MSMYLFYRRLAENKLDAMLKNPGAVDDFLESEVPETEKLDIDRSWEAMHFLLTGLVSGGKEPLVNAVLGGSPVDCTEDYRQGGPIRYLRSVQVDAVANALENITHEEFAARFDQKYDQMVELRVYSIDAEDKEGDKNYVCFHFKKLKSFFSVAASHGDAMLIYIV